MKKSSDNQLFFDFDAPLASQAELDFSSAAEVENVAETPAEIPAEAAKQAVQTATVQAIRKLMSPTLLTIIIARTNPQQRATSGDTSTVFPQHGKII